MRIETSRTDPVAFEGDSLIVMLPKVRRVPRALRPLDAALGGRIQEYLDAGAFSGDSEEHTGFPATGIEAGHLVLVGLGEERRLDAGAVRDAVGRAVGTLVRRGKTRAAIAVPATRRLQPRVLGEALAEGAVLGAYRFDRYRTLAKPPPGLDLLALLAGEAAQVRALRAGVADGVAIAESTALARDCANEPGSVATPAWLASVARRLGREHGLRVRVLAERELQREKMGGILAVGRGSANPPRLIAMEHGAAGTGRGARRRPTVALVGKGITFDTGGISIKPAANMDQMKGDMSGGAAVIGALRGAALLKLPLHVVGIVAAAQNMPDGGAYLPGDVVTTASGKTIEVLNTDAEGRIVLADGLHYATRFEPAAIIDVATLTGAKVVALGTMCCAVMSNDDRLVRRVREAGERAGERAWQLPLWDEHKRLIRGDVGDLKNLGGREASSSTAAALLSHFVGDTPWAHLDIAGNEMTARDQPCCPKGATGFGVRLLLELLRRWR